MAIYKRVAGNLIIESIGAANTVTFQNTTGVANVVITGDLSVSGNASLTGNISGDKLFNGTTSIEIQTASGNANITVGGTSNVFVANSLGTFVNGFESVTGNVIGGNIRTAGQVSATGNITSGNLTVATGNIVLTQTSGTTSSQMIQFNDANTAISVLGANIGSIDWYSSDATGLGPRTTASIKAVYSDANGNANVLLQTNSTTRIAVLGTTGNVGIANTAPLHTFAVTGNTYVSGTETVIGNITGGNLNTGAQVVATGNITGGNLITSATGGAYIGNTAVGAANVIVLSGSIAASNGMTAGAGGFSATGNVTGGNVNSASGVSATGIITAGGGLNAQGNVSATGNVIGITGIFGNANVTGNMFGTGIGVENIVWQSTDTTVASLTPVSIGVLTFTALANQVYKFNAMMFTVPDGSMTTAFGVNFSAGTCQYTVEGQTTATSAFSSVYTSNVSNAMSSTQNMTGTTLRSVRVTGTFTHTANTVVTVNGQASTGILTVKSGSNLSYTRIG
jgi:hypothetical protein